MCCHNTLAETQHLRVSLEQKSFLTETLFSGLLFSGRENILFKLLPFFKKQDHKNVILKTSHSVRETEKPLHFFQEEIQRSSYKLFVFWGQGGKWGNLLVDYLFARDYSRLHKFLV